MMDCKNALVEANNDFDKAVEIIRKGQAVAAKREDREQVKAVFLQKEKGHGAVVALQVKLILLLKTADFIALTANIRCGNEQ